MNKSVTLSHEQSCVHDKALKKICKNVSLIFTYLLKKYKKFLVMLTDVNMVNLTF